MSGVPGSVAITLLHLEAERRQHRFKRRKRAAFGGRHGRAADQGLEIGDGIGSGHGGRTIQREWQRKGKAALPPC